MPRFPELSIHKDRNSGKKNARINTGKGGLRVKHWIIDIPIYLGSALMVYNIYGFIRFSREVRRREVSNKQNGILYFPIPVYWKFPVS